jgi:hypothetical protein
MQWVFVLNETETIILIVSERKVQILVKDKAAGIFRPQAQRRYVEDRKIPTYLGKKCGFRSDENAIFKRLPLCPLIMRKPMAN